MEKIKGLVAAPFTPMTTDGAINLNIIPSYYQFLKQNGVAGAFINGSTGEGVSQTMQERKQVTEAWANEIKQDASPMKLINLVGGTSYQECIELAKHSQSVGVDAIAILAPFYFKPPSVKELAEFVKMIGQAVPELPVYFYHIPVLTGVGFAMIDLMKELHGQMPNFAGIKYTHEDFMDYLSCLHFADGQYDMLWGRDENMLSALVLGAEGSVGSTFNYAAPLYHQLMAAYEKGEIKEARLLQQQSIDMIRLLGKYGGIGTGKAFMRYVGIECGGFRLPVKAMAEEAYQQFVQDVKALEMEALFSKGE
ncbi:dihydrodipicolinate synthase family protein [Carboxylicivirga caseinilyticus]|uniref:dihydrodipicolinate synthase family protein n=1 Tax=Carboxylicivirga caseinilyticus TaxID=3417572 RepID=UPI003D32C3C8|nr:dihydrodipicolinate synthase family protein [Marinilabiliaceae bacterium A049]